MSSARLTAIIGSSPHASIAARARSSTGNSASGLRRSNVVSAFAQQRADLGAVPEARDHEVRPRTSRPSRGPQPVLSNVFVSSPRRSAEPKPCDSHAAALARDLAATSGRAAAGTRPRPRARGGRRVGPVAEPNAFQTRRFACHGFHARELLGEPRGIGRGRERFLGEDRRRVCCPWPPLPSVPEARDDQVRAEAPDHVDDVREGCGPAPDRERLLGVLAEAEVERA